MPKIRKKPLPRRNPQMPSQKNRRKMRNKASEGQGGLLFPFINLAIFPALLPTKIRD
ncbi:MAG: hypothetical protein ACI93T_004382 [Porticoccaceae bacterium]